MKNFGSRMIDLAVSVLFASVLLSFAWSIIRPLAPVLGVAAVGVLLWRYLARGRGF